MLNFFTITKLDFANKRWIKLLSELTAEDRELFFCDIKDFDWDNYFQSYILGIRLYIIKDPIETLPQARIKYRRYLLSCILSSLIVYHSEWLSNNTFFFFLIYQTLLDTPNIETCYGLFFFYVHVGCGVQTLVNFGYA